MSPKPSTRRIGRSAMLLAASGVVAALLAGAWPGLAQAAGPSITAIAPSSGSAAGGTQVTIAGSGFTIDSTVSFGSVAVKPTFVSSTELMATSPAGSGTVNITVSNQSGTSAIGAADQFTYISVPVVTGISPKIGLPAGGTTVTVTGTGFTANTSVTFGGVSVPVTVNSSTSLTVVSPAGTGTVDIVVFTEGGVSSTGPGDQFTFGVPSQPPAVTTGSATGVSQRAATIDGAVDAGGQKITSCQFQYGLGTRFALTMPCGSGGKTPGSVQANLTNLTPGATYHYRLVAATAGGTTTGPTMTFTTLPPPVIGAPRVGLLLSRVKNSGYIAELVGIKGIAGGAVGQSLVMRCVTACQYRLKTTIPLLAKRDLNRKIGLSRGLLVSTATRIVINLAVKGKLSSYASYAFFISRGTIAVKIAKTGCVQGSTIQKCPSVPATA